MTYTEKLRDPRWQKCRLHIMERDGFTCQHCKSTQKTLNVHHFFYIGGRDPWDYPAWSLITYCEACHEMAEQSRLLLLKVVSGLNPIGLQTLSLFLADGFKAVGDQEFVNCLGWHNRDRGGLTSLLTPYQEAKESALTALNKGT